MGNNPLEEEYEKAKKWLEVVDYQMDDFREEMAWLRERAGGVEPERSISGRDWESMRWVRDKAQARVEELRRRLIGD